MRARRWLSNGIGYRSTRVAVSAGLLALAAGTLGGCVSQQAYDDLAASNSSLGCTDNLAWAGCYIDWGIDIGQCPDTNTQVAVDIADCLN